MWWDSSQAQERAPACVVRPKNDDELSNFLAWANRRGLGVVARGGGSGVCGSAVPARPESIILDTARLNRILSLIEGPDPRVIVQAGMLGGALQRELNQKGYSLKHIPGSLEISTVGGWIATGSYGQLSTRHGGIDEQLGTIRAANPDGAIAQRSAGEMLRSEGSLGVITEAALKIHPISKRHFSLSCEFPDLETGLSFIRELIQSGAPPSLCRLYDPFEAQSAGLAYTRLPFFSSEERRFQLRFFLLRHIGLVRLLRLIPGLFRGWLCIMGFDEDQEDHWNRAQCLIRKEKILISAKEGRLWLAQRSQWNAPKRAALTQAGCFVDTIDVWAGWKEIGLIYERFVRDISPLALVMGHASHFNEKGACFFFIMAAQASSSKDLPRLYRRVWRDAMESVIAAGGQINHHHGIGLAKLPWKTRAYPEIFLDQMAERKRRMDPSGIMNPGKFI